MTVIGIVGGHNREALQALVNPLLEKGGVTELRILRLGNNDLIQALVHELILIHECRRAIYSCMISYCLPVALEENLLFPS